MIPFGIILTFAGYGIGSWGWILVKGYNISLGQWFSPLHPYQWPAQGDPPAVPKGKLFPPGANVPDVTPAGHRQGGGGTGPPVVV